MKKEQYNLLLEEYKYSRKQVATDLQSKWKDIFDEYGMRSFYEIDSWVTNYLSSEDFRLSHDASRGSLHVLCRKLLTLTSLTRADFSVRSKIPRDEDVAWILDHALRYEVARVGWSKTMRRNGLWAILTGTGIVKLGTDSVFQYDSAAYSGAIPRNANNTGRIKDMPYGGMTEYTSPFVKPGEVNMVHIPTTNVFSNPGATVFETITRLYVRHPRPLIDALRDSRYDTRARGQITTTTPELDEYDIWLDSIDTDARQFTQYCEPVEVIDLASRQVCVINEGCDKPLIDWQPMPLNVHNPYKFFTPIESTGTWRGHPYALTIFNQCRAINQLRALLKSKISRDGKTINLYDSDEIDDERLGVLRSTKDGEYFGIPGLGDLLASGKTVIQPLEFGGPNAEILNLINTFENDLQFMSGLDEPTRNMSGGDKKSATEVQVRQAQQNLTIEDYTARNEEFQEDVASDYMRIICQKWPVEKTVRVTGPNPYSYFWVPVRKEMLEGHEFTLEVVAGSTQKQDKVTYRRQLVEMIDRIVPIAQQAAIEAKMKAAGEPTSGLNWEEIIRLLVDAYEPALSNRILGTEDPVQRMIQLAESHGLMPTGSISADMVEALEQKMSEAYQSKYGVALQPGQNPQEGPPPDKVVPMQQQAGISPPVGPDAAGFTAQDRTSFQPMRQQSELAQGV